MTAQLDLSTKIGYNVHMTRWALAYQLVEARRILRSMRKHAADAESKQDWVSKAYFDAYITGLRERIRVLRFVASCLQHGRG